MKKVIFLFAMVLAASVAIAQTTANAAETEQDGNQNEVLVKQIGDLNEAESHQYGNQNDASVVQTGDENVGVADQLRGDRNAADVTQEGDLNEGYIIQGLTSDYYSGVPDAPLYNIAASDNTGSISQLGDGNWGDLGQYGNNNQASLEQEGNSNNSGIYQGWDGSWWNSAFVSGSNNVATVKQIGDNNFGGVWSLGDRNTTHLDQNGSDNMARLSQGYNYPNIGTPPLPVLYPVFDNIIEVTQNGNDNFVRNFQYGNNNILKLVQNGDGNTVGGRSTSGASYRNEYFQQFGNHNKLAGVFKNANNDLSFWQSQNAEQYNGATLDADSYQKGDYNDIGLRQGQDDLGLIQQDGIGNEALLWQQGANQNVATMMQFGNNNTSQVVQIQQ